MVENTWATNQQEVVKKNRQKPQFLQTFDAFIEIHKFFLAIFSVDTSTREIRRNENLDLGIIKSWTLWSWEKSYSMKSWLCLAVASFGCSWFRGSTIWCHPCTSWRLNVGYFRFTWDRWSGYGQFDRGVVWVDIVPTVIVAWVKLRCRVKSMPKIDI